LIKIGNGDLLDPLSKCMHSLDLYVAGLYDDLNGEVHTDLDVACVTYSGNSSKLQETLRSCCLLKCIAD